MTIDDTLSLVKRFLEPRRLSQLQEIVFRQSWEGQSYQEIADGSGYDHGHIRDVGSELWQLLSETLGEKVTKKNFQLLLKQRWSSLDAEELQLLEIVTPKAIAAVEISVNQRQDWGEAVNVSFFHGRDKELTTLKQWIVQDQCQLVAIFGMGGIGKTALAVKLAQQIQGEFEYLIWRSLRNAPPVQDLLAEFIQFISQQQEIVLPETVDGRVLRLLEYLRSSRCLLILDNVETILSSGERTNCCREGYEGYGQLLRCVAGTTHRSCLMLTSREQPRGWEVKLSETLLVRSLQLTGLSTAAGREIFRGRGEFQASEKEWEILIEHYAGNPLALKMVVPAIRDLFNSSVSKFLELLKQGALVFDDIRNLLDRQFNRLSNLEKGVMYWLAIDREPVSFVALQADFVDNIRPSKILEALSSLQRRSLIEVSSTGFTQQPAVMEYMTEKLVEQAYEELKTETIGLLMSHTLIKAQTKDYIRSAQVRMILEPLVAQLKKDFRSLRRIEDKLKQILLKLREDFSPSPGYGAGNLINLLRHCQIELTGYNFAGLAIWQADLVNVNLNDVNLANADLSRSTFSETFGSILWVVFSPDGHLVATGDADGEIRLWRAIDGQQICRYKGHTNWVRSVAFSPDGKTLASSSADCKVKLWNIHHGECLKTLLGHTSRVWSAVFSPDGRTLASGSDDRTVKLWNVEAGECLETFLGHTGRIRSVVFSSDGRTLVSGSDDKTVRLWHINTGQCFKVLQGHIAGIRTIAFNHNGQTLASGSGDASVKLWDTNNYQCLRSLQGHADEVWSVVFSPDGQTLATGSKDQTIKLWDVRDGKCLKTLQGHTNGVWSIDFSPDGNTLVSGGNDQTIRLWDIREGKCLKTLQGYTNGVRSVTCSPDGQILAVSSADCVVRLWDVHAGRCSNTLQGHTSQVWSVTFSPNGQILASGGEDQTIKLWNVRDGNCLKTLQGHTNWVWAITFSPNGQILASSSDDWTIKLWNVRDGNCLKTLQGHTNWVWSVTFSPNGQILASSSNDQTIKLWDVNTGECLKSLSGHTNGIRSIKFSPNGKTLCSGSEDYTVRLWDVSSDQCMKVLTGHTDWVWSVALSPDGRTLASGSNDQTIRLWDINTGQCLNILQGHSNWVRSVVFSPDGHTLISGSEDETTKLWNVKTGKCLNSLVSKKPYEGMNITGVTGLTSSTIATLKALGAIEL